MPALGELPGFFGSQYLSMKIDDVLACRMSGIAFRDAVPSSELVAVDASPDAVDADEAVPTNELAAMSPDERVMLIRARVISEVKAMVGNPVHPDEPLMSAGVDSRAAMELRQMLSSSVGVQLPVTML